MPGDGSGSVTQADSVQCGTAPNACGPAPVAQEGGKRKKRKSRKARKSRKDVSLASPASLARHASLAKVANKLS